MPNLFEEISNPNYCSKLVLDSLEKDTLLSCLKKMIHIRKVEQRLALERKNNKIGGPIHLGVGQEAIAAGLSESLTANDKIFGAHRSHSHLLSMNPDEHKLFAEVLGKDTGFSKGMGGSMHLWDKGSGFYGSVPIVSGTVPLALGCALSCKMKKTDSLAVAYLGDGAVEEGVVHESLNFASTFNLPIIFVVENNLFSSHMHISLRQPAKSTERFAEANLIKSSVVDGNNIGDVLRVSRFATNYVRNSMKPYFIEFITYRWFGHVDWREDVDVGVNRSKNDISAWKSRDPIKQLQDALIKLNYISINKISELEEEIDKRINKSWKQAEKDPYPKPEELLKRVLK